MENLQKEDAKFNLLEIFCKNIYYISAVNKCNLVFTYYVNIVKLRVNERSVIMFLRR